METKEGLSPVSQTAVNGLRSPLEHTACPSAKSRCPKLGRWTSAGGVAKALNAIGEHSDTAKHPGCLRWGPWEVAQRCFRPAHGSQAEGYRVRGTSWRTATMRMSWERARAEPRKSATSAPTAHATELAVVRGGQAPLAPRTQNHAPTAPRHIPRHNALALQPSVVACTVNGPKFPGSVCPPRLWPVLWAPLGARLGPYVFGGAKKDEK
jgi:hypothetical protein